MQTVLSFLTVNVIIAFVAGLIIRHYFPALWGKITSLFDKPPS
jgi:hypothetical protein